MKVEFFYTHNCKRCPMYKNIVRQVVVSLEEKGLPIELEEIDCETAPSRAAAFRIMAVPAVAIGGRLAFVMDFDKTELEEAILEGLKET